MTSRLGQVPSGPQHRYRRGDRPVPPIRGAESQPPGEPPAPAPAPPAPAPAPPKPDDEPFDRDRAMRTIEALRAEAKDAKRLAKDLADAQAKLTEHETAKLSESERLTKKVADLEKALADQQAERRTILVRAEIERQARKLGVVDEGVAYKLLDLDALEFDDEGQPKNVERLLSKLLEQHPFLKASTEARPGVPATPRANGQTADQKIQENRHKLAASGQYPRLG